MAERCEAAITQGWHRVRCQNPAKHQRGEMKVCGVHERSRTVRLFAGCGCFIHAGPAPSPNTTEDREEG